MEKKEPQEKSTMRDEDKHSNAPVGHEKHTSDKDAKKKHASEKEAEPGEAHVDPPTSSLIKPPPHGA